MADPKVALADEERRLDFDRRLMLRFRGTAKQWIKNGKVATKWAWLSWRSFAANAVRLRLHALADNLGNFMRALAMPQAVEF